MATTWDEQPCPVIASGLAIVQVDDASAAVWAVQVAVRSVRLLLAWVLAPLPAC